MNPGNKQLTILFANFIPDAFSKELENHWFEVALYFVYYNFVKIHKAIPVPPAMQAGLIKR
jgi:hypothetical protein